MSAADIPTAAAMREQAEGVTSDRAQELGKRIAAAVVAAAARGARHVNVEGPRIEGVEKALRAKGYEVTWRSDQRDGSFYEVKW